MSFSEAGIKVAATMLDPDDAIMSFSETGIKVVATMLDPDDAINEKRLRCIYAKEVTLITM
jgi:hypothetical protein